MEEKKSRVQALTLALCVALLGLNLWQGKRLGTLEGRISDMQRHLTDAGSLYAPEQEADRLVQSWNYASSMNMEERCLDVEISVTLKEWRESTAAELLWTSGDGGEGFVPLFGDGKGTFTGVLSIPLDERRMDSALDIVIRDDGVRRREDLGNMDKMAAMLPVQCDSQMGRTQAEYRNDAFTVYECGAELYHVNDSSLPGMEGHLFRLRRNGEIAAEQAAEPGGRLGGYFCGRLSAQIRPGDRMALTFFCRDGNGLGYEFLLGSWIAVEERDVVPDNAAQGEWPKLTWN